MNKKPVLDKLILILFIPPGLIAENCSFSLSLGWVGCSSIVDRCAGGVSVVKDEQGERKSVEGTTWAVVPS